MATDAGPVRSSLDVLTELSLGTPVGQLRAVPVNLGPGAPRAVLAIYSTDFDVDPYIEMFFFPTDTLKMAVFTADGAVLWRRDLGPAVVPGVWFCPVFPFDLDRDGVDEVYFVNNLDAKHPLAISSYCLERVDAHDGRTTGRWEWPNAAGYSQRLSHTFRHFILGGHVGGTPVLVTAQGTYGDMFLQAWNAGLEMRWDHHIAKLEPGARGSHMCPIVDLDGDCVQEVMWGERCIELDGGTELFCADRETYSGHSDVVAPFLDWRTNRSYFYACREGDPQAGPRVALYDGRGRRVWGHVDQGHIDMGWVARLGDEGEPIAVAIRIGAKTCGPDGRFHHSPDEFAFDALSGHSRELPVRAYGAMPVDLNGDGRHELVYGLPGQDGLVVDHRGSVLGTVGGPVALLSKVLDFPGEQVLTYYPDGTVRIWGDRRAEDVQSALERYSHPLYLANQRLSAVGYNLPLLGGL